MKKIVFLLNATLNKPGTISGGDRRLVEIIKRFPSSLEKFCLTNQVGQGFLKEARGVKFIFTPRWFKYWPLIVSYILRTHYAWKVLRRQNIDVFYSSSDFFPDVLPAYLLKNKSNQWIQVIHHIYPHWGRREGSLLVNFFAFMLQRGSFYLIKKRADKIICVNKLVARDLIRRHGFPADKIHLNYNGLDVSRIENIEKSSIETDLIYLGRLKRSKGVINLPKIVEELRQIFYHIKLTIIGEGVERLILEKLIKKYKLEKHIEITGYLPDKEVISRLKAAQVFISLSHEEGFGISIAEAMSCGLPVVAWDLPAYKEIFKDKIMVVKEGNQDQLISKLKELLLNDEKRHQLGQEGREFIKKYSWEEVAQREFFLVEK